MDFYLGWVGLGWIYPPLWRDVKWPAMPSSIALAVERKLCGYCGRGKETEPAGWRGGGGLGPQRGRGVMCASRPERCGFHAVRCVKQAKSVVVTSGREVAGSAPRAISPECQHPAAPVFVGVLIEPSPLQGDARCTS